MVAVRLPKVLLYHIDKWASNYPGLDRSAVIRCLLDSGLHRQRHKPAPKIRDPASERMGDPDHKYHSSWLWYQRNGEPKRMSLWKDNFGDWGGHRREQANREAREQRVVQFRQRLNGVSAARKLLRRRKKKITAEAISALLDMPDVYAVDLVEDMLKRLGPNR